MGQMVDSDNISFPFSLYSKFLTWHWNSFGWWEVKESKSFTIKCLKRERDPSDAEKNLITSKDHLLKMDTYWQKNGDTAGCAFLKLKASGELRSDQANVWPLSKTRQSRWDLSDRSGKALQIFHSVWPRSTNKQIPKDLQGVFEISFKTMYSETLPPQERASNINHVQPPQGCWYSWNFYIEWHRLDMCV